MSASKIVAMRCRSTEARLREERVIARRLEERRNVRGPSRDWLLPIIVLCMIGIAGGIAVL
jgi:hypothetical protein